MQTRGRGRPAGPTGARDRQICIRVTEHEHEIIERLAEKLRLSKTDAIIRAVLQAYRNAVLNPYDDY